MSNFLYALTLLAVAAAIVMYVRRSGRKKRLPVLMQIARELAFVIGPGSELVQFGAGAIVVRHAGLLLNVPTRRLVDIHVQFSGQQREWHLRRLVGECQVQARLLARA